MLYKRSALGNEPSQLWGRLAHKSISIFFTSAKRERQIFYVFCRKSERESESSTTGTGNENGRTLRESGSGVVRLAKQERKLRSGFFFYKSICEHGMITNLRSTVRNFTAMKIPRTHSHDLAFVLIIERYRHAGCDCIISIPFCLF